MSAFSKFTQPLSRLRGRMSRFASDAKGTASVEFVIIAPFFIAMFLGLAAAAQGQNMSTKVAQVAATVSDVISQAPALSKAQIDAAMKAGEAIAGANDANNIEIVVAGVIVNNNGTTQVAWARGVNSNSIPTVGAPYTLPPDLTSESGFVVAAKTAYTYVPNVGTAFVPSFNLDSEFFYIPRVSTTTVCNDC